MLQCEACGRTDKLKTTTKFNKFGRVLCQKHYKQMLTHGRILERTRYDKNDFIDLGDFSKMELYDKDCKVVAHTLIDNDDLEKIKHLKWSLQNSGKGYVRNDKNKLYLHRFIMNAESGEIVDHKSRDILDNRKENLRKVDPSQNSQNSTLRNDNTTGVTGVYALDSGSWEVRITNRKETIALGRFSEKREAIIARLEAEKRYFGEEFAPQRNLFKQYNIK